MKRFSLSAAAVIFSCVGIRMLMFPSAGRFSVTTSLLSTNYSKTRNSTTATSIRYYIYTEESISKKARVQEAAMDLASQNRTSRYCCRDAKSETAVHDALEKHPLRTMDPSKADFFIVPTPIASLLTYSCFGLSHRVNCSDYDDAFDALITHPLFVNDDMGKRHVIINLHYLPFSRKLIRKIPALSRNYPKVPNVILANRFDPLQVQRIVEEKQLKRGQDYEALFRRQLPLVTRTGFSMASGLEEEIPLIPASMERFDASQFFLFYRSRRKRFDGSNSTQYRFAPFRFKKELYPSSIGHDLPKAVWLQHLQNSQFCLAIRGDSPETHAAAHAVKSGCIPVVISDWYLDWAGPFKSSLDMHDFCIFISEQEFLANPLRAMQGLKRIDRSVLEGKITALAHAQRVLFPDHPESLFVPAFLKEAKHALELVDDGLKS